MNKLLIAVVFVAIAVGGYFYLGSRHDVQVGDPVLSVSPEDIADTASPSAPLVLKDGTYALVVASSSMGWEGRKTLIVDYIDKGTVGPKEGNAVIKNGAVTSGRVVVDMATIHTLSTGKGSGESMQERHIKSDDFFDVATYPTATFAFGALAPASASGQFTLSGTLTVKGITQPVKFPVRLSASGDTLTMKAATTLDRTLWGIKYASGKFFQNLGDKIIGDEFGVSFTVVGRLVK